jgi:hemerythrin-like domain-containing protein
MKTATENLENDHVYILKLTEVMLKMSDSVSADTDHIATVIDVIRNYADGIHHAKEENLLFPKLETRGFSTSQGPVAVMLHEHVEGRNFVKGMADNLSLFKNGSREALSAIYRNMTGYASLLQNHIGKENNILFRMADKVLSDDEQKELIGKFEKVEQEQKPGSKPDDYITAIQKLAEIYHVV